MDAFNLIGVEDCDQVVGQIVDVVADVAGGTGRGLPRVPVIIANDPKSA